MAVALSYDRVPTGFDYLKAARKIVESRFPKAYWETAMRFFERLAEHPVCGTRAGRPLHAYSVLCRSTSYLDFVSSCRAELFGLPRTETIVVVRAKKMRIPKSWQRQRASAPEVKPAPSPPETKPVAQLVAAVPSVAPVTEKEIHKLFFDDPQFVHLTDDERYVAKRRALSKVAAHSGDPVGQREALAKVVSSVRAKPSDYDDADSEPRIRWGV